MNQLSFQLWLIVYFNFITYYSQKEHAQTVLSIRDSFLRHLRNKYFVQDVI